MVLDLRTIYVVGAATVLILGTMQLVAYASGRFDRWPLWWGLSNVLLGLGLSAGALRGHLPDALSIIGGNVLVLGAAFFLQASLRQFAGRPVSLAPYILVMVAAAMLLGLWIEPQHFAHRLALVSAISAACDIVIIRDCARIAREQRLATGWIVATLFVPTALYSIGRGGAGLLGAMGGELFPAAGTPDRWFAAIGVALLIIRSSALFRLATERSRSEAVSISREDAVTGARNRDGLLAALTELMIASRPGRNHRDAVLAVDIDHFRALNDTHGHAAGDRILRLLADSARTHLRSVDVLARQDGDRFTVLLPGMDALDASDLAERIRSDFALKAATLGISAGTTISIGVAAGNLASEPIEGVLRDAGEALRRAKSVGRNRVETARLAQA